MNLDCSQKLALSSFGLHAMKGLLKPKIGLLLGLLAAPLAGAAAAQEVLLPAGAHTDCGQGGTTYAVRPEVFVNGADDIENGRRRWGPGYACSSCVPLSACILSEAEKGIAHLYSELHNVTLTWQDGQDIGLVSGLASQIELDYCNQLGNCQPSRPQVVDLDRTSWSTGRAAAGDHPGNCPQAKATESPCGLQEAWECYWGHAIWIDNRAPHCGGTSAEEPPPPSEPPPGTSDPTCPAAEPCPPAPPCWGISLFEVERARRLCEVYSLPKNPRAAACAQYEWLRAHLSAGHLLCETATQ